VAGDPGPAAHAMTDDSTPGFLDDLERSPYDFDFHVVLRRLDGAYRENPRAGEAMRPSEEPVRLGQDPSTAFEPSALTFFRRPAEGKPGRLAVAFLGMFGPRGPLPVHITEYARDRLRNVGDATFTSFVDLFHHRMLLLFHRAWAAAQPTACQDRPETNRFSIYVGSLFGLALRAALGRDKIPDRAKLQYAARLAAPTRHAEGLKAIVSDYLRIPALVEQFIGEWIDLPEQGRWRLGHSRETSTLARSTILGARAWQCDHKFRLVLGPLSRQQFQRLLPGADTLQTLVAIVRAYVGDELDWDVRLVLAEGESAQLQLAGASRLGWNARLGQGRKNEDLIVNPHSGETQRAAWHAAFSTQFSSL
jgi:type VI secretion system protein ImpH